MKILFNCSINVVGGAVQNAANFIRYASQDSEISYRFIVSYPVYSILEKWEIDLSNVERVVSPSKSLASQKKIKEIEKDFKPDLVYTMAGPTYINFSAPHVLGISDPYITHAQFNVFFKNRGILEGTKHLLKIFVKCLKAKREGNYFLFQTETSRFGFCKRFGISEKVTSIIPNALGEQFLKDDGGLPSNKANRINILYPSAYYPHKNFEIIPEIIDILSKEKVKSKIVFQTTIAEESSFIKKFQSYFDASKDIYIENLKPFSYAEADKVYGQADIVFFPSLLETFSTSYLEAIGLNKPLVTSELPFATEICKKSAIYFRPYSAQDAASKIGDVFNQNNHTPDISNVLATYGDQRARYSKIRILLQSLKGKL